MGDCYGAVRCYAFPTLKNEHCARSKVAILSRQKITLGGKVKKISTSSSSLLIMKFLTSATKLGREKLLRSEATTTLRKEESEYRLRITLKIVSILEKA